MRCMTSLEIVAVVAQRDDRGALGLEHLADEPLVGLRAVLVAAVLDLGLPGARAFRRRRR